MSKKSTPAFATIKPTALEAVSGGRRSSTSSRGTDDRIMDSLNSLENAIRDVGRNNQNQPDPMSQMMPLLAMTMMNQPAAAPPPPAQPQVIYVGRRRC